MAQQDSTNQPDRRSQQLPALVRERFDLEPAPEPTDYERGKLAGRRLGAYAALGTARRTLRQAGPAALAQALNGLASVDDLAETLRQLEDAADRAAERSDSTQVGRQ